MNVPVWLAGVDITRSWARHIELGSSGGVDWATPYGTEIKAPSDGVLYTRTLLDQASVVGVRRPDGTETEFVHAHPRGPLGRTLQAGEVMGITDGRKGMPGSGVGPTASTGAHVHVHDRTPGGTRVRPFSTVSAAQLAASALAPLKENPMSDELLKSSKTGKYYYRDGPFFEEVSKTEASAIKRARGGGPRIATPATIRAAKARARRYEAFLHSEQPTVEEIAAAVVAALPEEVDGPEDPQLAQELAEQTRRDLASELELALDDDADALALTLQQNIPAAALQELVPRLQR